jgi:hypothetical protein
VRECEVDGFAERKEGGGSGRLEPKEAEAVEHVLVRDLNLEAAWRERRAQERRHGGEALGSECGVERRVEDACEPAVVVSGFAAGVGDLGGLPVIVVTRVVEELVGRLLGWGGLLVVTEWQHVVE